MGWRDRDYSQDTQTERDRAPFNLRWPPRATRVLILLHLASFVAVLVTGADVRGAAITRSLALSEHTLYPLAILLHPLAARDVLSFLLSTVLLWWLGSRVELQHGGRWLIGLYLAGNVLAGAAFFALARSWPALAHLALDHPAGALAAWTVAGWRGLGGSTVMLFGRLRNASHVAAAGLATGILLTLAFWGPGATAWLAALAAGALAEPAFHLVPSRSSARLRRRLRPVVPTSIRAKRPPSVADEIDIDDILVKISRTGLASLSQDDRERLEAARQAKLRNARSNGLLR